MPSAEKVLGCVFFFNFLYLPFNNAIAAVCPIKEQDSQHVFWNYWDLHEPCDCPGGDIIVSQLFLSLWHWCYLASTEIIYAAHISHCPLYSGLLYLVECLKRERGDTVQNAKFKTLADQVVHVASKSSRKCLVGNRKQQKNNDNR